MHTRKTLVRSKLHIWLSLLAAVVLMLLVSAGCGSRRQSQSGAKQPETSSKQTTSSAANVIKQDGNGQANAAVKTDGKKQQQLYKPVEDTGPKLELSQKGVTLKWIEQGVLRMSATAKEFQGNDIQKTGTLIDFTAQLYEDGKLIGSITAPKAVADTVNRVVTATGGVTLKSTERNTVIKSSWMKWYARQQKVVGNGGVKATSTMGTMEGAAFVADTGMKTIRIMSSAKGLLP